MAYSHLIPVVSATAGDLEDGALIGNVLMGAGGTNHPPSFFPAVNSATYIGFADVPKGMVRRSFQKAADVRTRVIEYLASDNLWKTLTGWNDPSNDFKNGPTTLTSKTITGLTRANPCVVTSASHGYTVGRRLHFIEVAGMTEVNGKYYKVTAATTNTYTLNVDSTNFTTYTSGGKSTEFNEYQVAITAPSDWASKSQTFATDSGNVTTAAYWLRERTIAVSVIGPAQTVHANVRAKQFGDNNTLGIAVPVATTLRGVTIEEPYGESGTGEIGVQLVNLSKGTSVSFTIPAGPTWPLNVDVMDLALAANEKYGLFVTSGTRTWTSVPIILHA